MRLLITGGAGFIGSNLAALAVATGIDVTILDNLATGHMENVQNLGAARFIHGSVLDPPQVDDALVGVDCVIHLAALGSVPRSIVDPVSSHAVNASGTLTILERARRLGVSNFIFSSSSSVYGMNPNLPKSERDWVRPMSPYAVTKLAAEQYVLAYQQSYGMQTLAFRFFNVYGPGQRPNQAYAAVIPLFIDALLKGEKLTVNGDGQTSRDFTYVGTVCRVLLDAAIRQVSYPEPVNLAYGTNTTLNELILLLSQTAGLNAEVRTCPERAGDVKHSRANNSTLRLLFPEVQPTTLTEGLTSTLAWFMSTLSNRV